jgi:hypothetical protein
MHVLTWSQYMTLGAAIHSGNTAQGKVSSFCRALEPSSLRQLFILQCGSGQTNQVSLGPEKKLSQELESAKLGKEKEAGRF